MRLDPSTPAERLAGMIPLATGAEFDFGNDGKGMARYRSQLYGLNKDNAAGWKFRTMRNGSLLMVWRLA